MNHSLCRILILKSFKTNNCCFRSAVNLAYKIHGKSPPEEPTVFVLHGLLGSKRNWESMSKQISLNTKKSVVAVDLRNHGESEHDKTHTYGELASDVSRLINKLSVKDAILIGHSMGGRTAMVLALTETSKVNRLVVVDISPVSTAGVLNQFFPKLISIMNSIEFKGAINLVQARSVAKQKILESGIVKDVDSMYFVLMNIGTRHDGSFGWMCNLDALQSHFTDIATFPPDMSGKTYHGRTLFIGGIKSNYLPKSDITGIKSFFPKAELKYIDAGHNVHAENPSIFLNIVTEFIFS